MFLRRLTSASPRSGSHGGDSEREKGIRSLAKCGCGANASILSSVNEEVDGIDILPIVSKLGIPHS